MVSCSIYNQYTHADSFVLSSWSHLLQIRFSINSRNDYRSRRRFLIRIARLRQILWSYRSRGTTVVRDIVDLAFFELGSLINSFFSKLTDESDEISEPKGSSGGGDVYFEVLHLQPIQLDLSFMRTDRVNVDQK